MKKCLTLAVCLLAYAFSAVAQQTHWSYQQGQFKNETFIYADVKVGIETTDGYEEHRLSTLDEYNAYEYAAFIGDELRGIATIIECPNNDIAPYLLRFRIEGSDSDINSSSITFKAYDKEAGKELDLNPESEQPVFTGETDAGIPSRPAPLVIYYPLESTPVSSIVTPFYGWDADTGGFSYIECNVGDDLTPYFVDGQAFTVLPAEATDKSVTFSLYEGNQSLAISETGAITATTTGAGVIKVTSVDNPQISCLVFVTAYNDINTISWAQDELTVTYKDQAVDISQEVMSLLVLGEGDTMGDELSLESSEPEVVEINDQGAYAKKPGEAVLTVKLPVVNRLMKTFDPNGNHTTYATATLHVTVVQGVTGIQVEWPTTLATGQTSQLIVRPVPQGAHFNATTAIGISSRYLNFNESVDNTSISYDEDTNTYIGTITCDIPGELELTVNYDDDAGTFLSVSSEVIECGYTFVMNQGWEWRTIPYANFNAVNGLQTVFGNELIEIRTQNGQLYNDPVYGYFGDTDLLDQNVGFKLKMEGMDMLKSYVFYGGSLSINNVSLRKGWNYLPNPYVTVQTLGDAFSLNKVLVDGDRIVSKTGGFAEYANGQWTGNLTTLQPGESYLFFNAGDANRSFIYADELNPANARRASARATQESSPSIWKYDASRFRDNMTIIASIDNRPAAGHYSIGAFVGDECRGEGVAVDGRLFITVHANNGEVVSFKLYDETTGQVYDIDQQLPMQQMLGTVKQPYSMTANDVVTSIDDLPTASLRQQGRSYDLLGRPTTDRQMVKGQLRIVDGKKMLK